MKKKNVLVSLLVASGISLGSMSGCYEVEAKNNNGFCILKETEHVYVLHSATFENADFTTPCGYKTYESKVYSYVYNDKKNILLGNPEFYLYQNKEDIHTKVLENVEHCPECFGE